MIPRAPLTVLPAFTNLKWIDITGCNVDDFTPIIECSEIRITAKDNLIAFKSRKIKITGWFTYAPTFINCVELDISGVNCPYLPPMDNLRILNITNIDSRFDFYCLQQFKLHKLIADRSTIKDEHLALILDHISLRACRYLNGSGLKYLSCKSIDLQNSCEPVEEPKKDRPIIEGLILILTIVVIAIAVGPEIEFFM
jgi:hypothetical protein